LLLLYKLHIDTADCGVPVSALLSSASMHDSLAAMPLALMTAERVTNCYDLMDAAYCSSVLREQRCIIPFRCVVFISGVDQVFRTLILPVMAANF
jgi:hypothetical protein